MRLHPNVPYVDRGHQTLAADIALPESTSGPFIVYCHGGGWISGDRSMYSDELAWATSQGFAAATVSYRLAPLNTFPACVADLQDFVMFARRALPEIGFQPSSIIAIGNSAGGYLACMLNTCNQYFGDQADASGFQVDGAVGICPITDLTDPRAKHNPISWSFLEQFMGALDGIDEQLRLASPIHHVSSQDGPLLLLHGDEDDVVPVAQSVALEQAMKAVGAHARLKVLPGEMHSFTWPAWQRIRDLSAEFVRSFEGAQVSQ